MTAYIRSPDGRKRTGRSGLYVLHPRRDPTRLPPRPLPEYPPDACPKCGNRCLRGDRLRGRWSCLLCGSAG